MFPCNWFLFVILEAGLFCTRVLDTTLQRLKMLKTNKVYYSKLTVSNIFHPIQTDKELLNATRNYIKADSTCHIMHD